MDVKRRRDATTIEIERGIAKSDYQICTFGASIMDLAESLLIDILLRLPLKGILVCKCICKSWRHLILSPQFAKLHFSQSQTSLLVRKLDSTCVPRICYLIDPSEIDIKSCLGCDEEIHTSLDVKLKIPLRNPREALEMEAVKKNLRVRLKLTDHKFRIVNSYNGFLCLSEPSANEPAVICNPVTGEYINIPDGQEAYEDSVDCGFGFCPTTNQYKVIRIFDSGDKQLVGCPITERHTYSSRMAEVYTLSTQSWENVGYAPCYFGKLTSPFYLNGNLHWFHHGWSYSNIILSFDFTNESFQNFPPPPFRPFEFSYCYIPHMSLCELRGNLCLCLPTHDSVSLWVMEKYGVRESWIKFARFRKAERESNYMFHPINYLKCGSLLMFYYPKNLLIHYNVETKEWSCLKVCGTQSKCEAIPFIPSFFSLQEAVQGSRRTVLNIRSWCAKVKLQGENKGLYIREEDKSNLTSDSSTYFTDIEEWDGQDWNALMNYDDGLDES